MKSHICCVCERQVATYDDDGLLLAKPHKRKRIGFYEDCRGGTFSWEEDCLGSRQMVKDNDTYQPC